MGNSSNRQENLNIKILTGETQSMQLFDFHSPQKQQSVSDLKFPSVIGYSVTGEITYSPHEFPQSDSGVEPLYRIELNNFKDIIIRELFERSTANEQQNQSYIWKVLGDGELMRLTEGDIIKVGKTRVKFKEIVSSKISTYKNVTIDRDETQRNDKSMLIDSPVKHADGQCRLCFENTQNIMNPLVSLCKCSGSVKYIHYDCLKDWISSNIKKQKSPNCLFYSYLDPTCCELCKEPLSNYFIHEGQKYSLYEFEKIEPPYAIFQNRFLDEESNKIRVSVYNISIPENEEISIGRNHTSHVILKDISVSRSHCLITYRNGQLFIQDKKSKFGTLICPRRGFEFDSVSGLQLQLYQKIIQISQASAFNGCCCNSNNSYYVEINKSLNDHTL